MKTQTIFVMTALIISSCSKTSLNQVQSRQSLPEIANGGSENGVASARPVYYDGNLVT